MGSTLEGRELLRRIRRFCPHFCQFWHLRFSRKLAIICLGPAESSRGLTINQFLLKEKEVNHDDRSS
jgi:hypothetical protein